MKVGFVTCVQIGMECIREIYSVGGHLDLMITLPDDLAKQKSGRIFLDKFCSDHSIPLIKSRNVNDPFVVESVKKYQIDWLFIIGWSQIARTAILTAPRNGVLGMHPTLLPEGRGRAAIPWAILKGLKTTGVTLFILDEGMDTGPILAQQVVNVNPNETATSLYTKVALAHKELIRRIWPDIKNELIDAVPQNHAMATVWEGRLPADGLILPDMHVESVERLVRAVTHPYPGAFWEFNGKIYRIWAGKIGKKEQDVQKDVLRLELADGVYDCYEFEVVESIG